MPKILEIKSEGDQIWVRIGEIGQFESGVALWTPEEQQRKSRESYNIGYDDASEGKPREPI